MAKHVSRHFNAWQLASLQRLGDLYIPGSALLPAFSKTDCLANIDIVLDEVDAGDVALLALLLTVLRCVPRFALQWLLAAMEHHQRYPEWLAGWLRLISLALKGVVMSLYYSGWSGVVDAGSPVHQGMGYQLHCEPDQPKQDDDKAKSTPKDKSPASKRLRQKGQTGKSSVKPRAKLSGQQPDNAAVSDAGSAPPGAQENMP